MPTERELKFLADADFVLPPLDDDGLRVVRLGEQRLDATYYDTEDFRLSRWGASLRWRKGESGSGSGIWTVKLPKGYAGGAVVRGEHAFDGSAGDVPDGARFLVVPFARTQVLRPVARLVTRRKRTEIRDERGVPLLEVDDDAVATYEGRRVTRRFREIEVELRDGATDDVVKAVGKRLRDAGAVVSDRRSKVSRALDVTSTDGEIAVVEPGKKARVGEVVSAAIASSVRRLLVHDPGVRIGDDPEDVHQARVAVRRLRSDLQTFSKYLDPEVTRPLRDELRALGQALGRVRDADVLYERLSEQAAALPRRDARATAALLRKVSSERAAARAALLAELGAEPYAQLLDRLVGLALDPPLNAKAAKERAATVLPKVVASPWRKLDRAASALGKEPSVEELHDIRIKVKRARYAAEAVTPAVGKDAAAFAKAMADLQGVLGDLQDAVVAEAWLRDRGLTAAPSAALVAGELVTVERELIDAGLRSWQSAWKKASKKSLRSWLP